MRPSPCTTMTDSASAPGGGEEHPEPSNVAANAINRNGLMMVGKELFYLYRVATPRGPEGSGTRREPTNGTDIPAWRTEGAYAL